jgi:hypothetical protein
VASVELANPSTPSWPLVKGSGSFDLARATGQVVVRNPRGLESVVYLPTGVFDRPAPGGATSLPQGRPWVRADYNERLRGSIATQFLLALESANMGLFLAETAWGAKTAAPLGPRVVNHTPATGYLVRVDPAQAAAAATGPRAQGLVRIASLMKGDRTIRVWVDRSGRVVAVRTSVPVSGTGDSVMTVKSFGALAVHPAPPDRRQVVDLAALTAAGDQDGD